MSAKPELKSVPDETDPVVEAISTSPPDPFDLNSLRLDQSFVESSGVKKLLTTVPVRKPNSQDFVRVHPGEEYRGAFAVIILKDDGETFLLSQSVATELPGEFVTVQLFTTINLQGVPFLWPVRLPAQDGRIEDWSRSALDAAKRAMKLWVRVRWNRSLKAYEQEVAQGTHSEPAWPDLPFQELVRLGFRDRLIDNLDHAVVKRLRGL